MFGLPYPDAMHVDRANLIMGYLSICWSIRKPETPLQPLEYEDNFYDMQ